MNDLTKRLARLPADRRAQLLALLQDGETVEPRSAVPVPRQRGATIPLAYQQEALWLVSRLAPEQPMYNQPLCFRIIGHLDIPALRRSLAALVERHEMLRTSVTEGPDGPMQTVHARVPVEVPVMALLGGDDAQRRAVADAWLLELSRDPFALDRAPLWRAGVAQIEPDEHLFVFVVHHVVYDGWSLNVLLTELAERYRAEVAGEHSGTTPAGEQPDADPAGRLDFGDYVLWQRDWLAGETLSSLALYWRDRLAGAPVLEFPTDRSRPPELSYRGAWLHRTIHPDAGQSPKALARSLGTTANVVGTAVFLALLHRCTGSEDLVIGAPNAGREHTELESVFGCFVSMLPLRTDLSGDPTFRELVGRVRTVVEEGFAHGALPFGKLLDAVRPARDPSRAPLFQIAFSVYGIPAELALPGLVTERVPVDYGTTRYDMSWDLIEVARDLGGTGVEIAVNYSTDLFDAATIETLADLYENVLRAVAADPELPLSRIPLLDERQSAALQVWNGPPRAIPDTTVPELFAAQVARRPDEIAVVASGAEVTYAELDRRANQLAHLLRAAGAEPGRLVAFCLPRGTDLIVTMLAVLKAGAAYVPLDPTHPPARLATLLQDCQPVAVVATGATAGNLPPLTVPVIRFDTDRERLAAAAIECPQPTAGPRDLAYVLYTSGSTGTPKGVLIEHRSVVNFIGAMQDLFELTEADRMLGFAASTFDVSVFETFSALLTGARLYLATDEERLDIDLLQGLLERSAATVVDLPPPMMALLVPERLPALRIVFVGAEAFPGELVNRWNPGRRFFNGYGPTECTVTMIIQECPGHWQGSPPIGLPTANHVAHVLDPAGRPVPIGIPGELVIGGAGLARGYLNRPELTQERFYPDPFGTAPGGRLYRTGDLVKRQRDGALVFLGRIDHQVKIRGIRVELGEIESVLSRHPGIDQVAVDVHTDKTGNKQLVCYLAGRSGPIEPASLRDWLAGHLPAYMLPSYWVTVDSLPLNSSGKVDRKRLPAPEDDGEVATQVEFADETERELATEIVGPVLGLRADQIAPDGDFFQLGGDSLAAARVVSRIRGHFSVTMSLADFFRGPTVRALAGLVASRRSAAVSDAGLLALLDSLTDDEAAVLLAEPADEAGR
jgi:amino acid adenylation domain-containing protein